MSISEATQQSLTESFAALRANARSMDDVQDWLLAHPETLVGDIKVHPSDKLDIAWTTDLDMLSKALKVNTVEITLTVCLRKSLTSHPVLMHEMDQSIDAPSAELRSRSSLHMRLQEWPLATAMVVNRYGAHYSQASGNSRNRNSSTEAMLDRYLAIHFPGVTVATVMNLLDSDLLPVPVTRDGRRDKGTVIDLLFSSWAAGTDVQGVGLPYDMS